MLSVVVWLWQESTRLFLPAHVNTMRKMLARHLPAPHRFICVCDSTEGFASDVEVLLTPPPAAQAGKLRNPEGPRFPNCYRRLWNFSTAASAAFGERILALDIDLVALADLQPLLDTDEDFVGVRPHMRWGNHQRVAGGMYLLRTGTRCEVWERFKGAASIAEARRAGFRGSDQAWISYCLGKNATVWPEPSGLYSIRDLKDGRLPLPADARLVQFNGRTKPWDSRLPWVTQHWQ